MKLSNIIIVSALFAIASVTGISAENPDATALTGRTKTKIEAANEARKVHRGLTGEDPFEDPEDPFEDPMEAYNEEGYMYEEEGLDARQAGMQGNMLRGWGGGRCRWKGKWYNEHKWAYDCNAKYDKCQCECDWQGKNCGWKNCRDDHKYCGNHGGEGCKWKGEWYDEYEWAYDCGAKYDKCQCKNGNWKNCRNDYKYCGW